LDFTVAFVFFTTLRILDILEVFLFSTIAEPIRFAERAADPTVRSTASNPSPIVSFVDL
jgi:hypothetical protein